MKNLQELLQNIRPLSPLYLEKAQKRLNNLTKPVGSLGKLEEIAQRYSAIKESLTPSIKKKMIATFAGDHGVVAQGTSAYPKEVTIQMVFNMLDGGAAINILGKQAGAEVVVVDIGVDHDFKA